MRYTGAMGVLFLVSACSAVPHARSQSEMEDIASDTALDATAPKFSELEGRIDALETEKAELEAKALSLEADVSAAEAKALDAESEITRLRSDYESHTH